LRETLLEMCGVVAGDALHLVAFQREGRLYAGGAVADNGGGTVHDRGGAQFAISSSHTAEGSVIVEGNGVIVGQVYA